MTLKKIVSGGQTGVDRGALDAAIECGFPCGGWCPEGRLAEDGAIPTVYPLHELENAGYRQRTIRNVVDSDATLIIYWSDLSGGTEQTLLHCIKRHKPYKLIDASVFDSASAAEVVVQFLENQSGNVQILNVAGPRESSSPEASVYAKKLINSLIAGTQYD